MKNTQKFFALFKKELFCIRTSPIFYLSWAFYCLAASSRFFFQGQFFSQSSSTDLRFLFQSIPYISILVFPLLTLITGEKPFDSLLPVSSLALFLAKIASLLCAFAVMNVLLLFCVLSVSFFGDIDAPQAILGFLGIFLYGVFAFSLNVFLLSLLKKNTLFFLFSALLLFVFNSAHLFALYTGLTGFFALAMQFFSFSWHFDTFSKGILDSRDILFYIVWAIFFLFASCFASSIKSGDKRFSRLFTFFALDCVLLTSLSSRVFFRADFSRDKQFSVSKYSEDALSKADEVIRIKYFLSGELKRLYPQVRDVQDFLLQYCAKGKNVQLSVINPDSKEGQQGISVYNLQSQQLRSAGKNKTEYINVYSSIVVEYLGQIELLPFELSTATLEYDLTRAVEKMVSGITRRALLVSGNSLDIDTDYSYVRPWLESGGIKTDAVSGFDLSKERLEMALSRNETLLIFGSSSFTQQSAESLSRFLDKGGSAFFCVSALDVDISSDWAVSERKEDFVLPLLEAKGIRLEKAIVADICSSQIIMDSEDENGAVSHDVFNYPLWVSVLQQKGAKNGVTVFWGNPVTVKGANAILATTKASWLLEKQADGENVIDTNPFRIPKAAGTDDKKGQFFLGAQKDSIMVVADQYFASSLMLSYINNGANPDFRNLDFISDSVLHLQNADALASLKHTSTSKALYKITDADDFLFFMRISLFLTLVLPVLVIASCALFSAIVRRRSNLTEKRQTVILSANSAI